MENEDLIAFIVNIKREARKGYYCSMEYPEQEQDWINGYCTACDDLLQRITGEDVNHDTKPIPYA